MIPLEPNTVYLTGFAREAVLSAILEWVDPVLFVNQRDGFNLKLRKEKGPLYLGTCPWCRKNESLIFNRITTKCVCSSCNEFGDLLDLVQEEKVCDTQNALDYLVRMAESCKKQYDRRKAKAGKKKDFRSSFEMEAAR